MVIYFFQIIFFLLIKSSFQSKNIAYESIIYYNDNDTNLYEEKKYIGIFDNDISDDISIEFFIKFLNTARKEPETIKNLFLDDDFQKTIKEYLQDYLDLKKYGFLYNLTLDFLNKSNPYINYTFDMVKNCTNHSQCIIDSVINILDYLKKPNNYTISFLYDNLCDILNYPGFEDFFKSLDKERRLLFLILKINIEKSAYSDILKNLEDTINNKSAILNSFIYNIIKNYRNRDSLVELVYNFIQNNTDLMSSLTELFRNETILNALNKAIHYEDVVLEAIKTAILKDSQIVEFFISIINHKSIINTTLALIINSEKGDNSINGIPELINEIIKLGYYDQVQNLAIDALKKFISLDDLIHFVNDNFVLKVKKIIDKYKIFKFDISRDCEQFMNTIYFSDVKNMTYLRNFFLRKIILKTSLNKNDLLFYDICLESENIQIMPELNFDVKPIFVMGIVDDLKNSTKLKKSILHEKYNYY